MMKLGNVTKINPVSRIWADSDKKMRIYLVPAGFLHPTLKTQKKLTAKPRWDKTTEYNTVAPAFPKGSKVLAKFYENGIPESSTNATANELQLLANYY